MDEKDLSRDEVAEKVFGYRYATLSAWGQRHVDDIISKFTRVQVPHTATLNDVNSTSIARDNERLSNENTQLRIENGEIWQENQELRTELQELRERFNLSDS